MRKKGILLINLGTPDDTSLPSIKKYLKEFLLDKRVVSIPAPLRYLLVYGLILPFRPKKTAKAYQKIWQSQGSPLRFHMQNLTTNLQQCLGDSYQVSMGMRYGNPSQQSGLEELKDCNEIVALPLFPQYSSAATGSAITQLIKDIKKYKNPNWKNIKIIDPKENKPLDNAADITIIENFYNHPSYINAYSQLIKPYLNDPDTFLLLSYHGLPEKQLDKNPDNKICSQQCSKKNTCPGISCNTLNNDNDYQDKQIDIINNEKTRINKSNKNCYRAQCFETSRAIAMELELSDNQYMTSFQSRLGRIPWIKPYTDETLSVLREQGITNLAVACPGFTIDCLETLEEIGMGIKADWLAMGGESFQLVPCLNEDSYWIMKLLNQI